jgi:DNA-binding LacI/PurR family transcriptional regulator
MADRDASPVTIADVARAAGVSLTTVSRAVSGNGRLSDKTRQRVRAVATQMGYRPNPVARTLAGGKTGVVAIAFSLPQAIPVALVDFFNDTIRGATQRALMRDYALIVGPPTPHAELWLRVAFDGLVVVDPMPRDPVVAQLRRVGTGLVFIGRDPDGTPEDYCIDRDFGRATRAVLDHLRDQGGQRIGLICGEFGESFTADCIDAYIAWCARRGAPRLIGTAPPDRIDAESGAGRAFRAAGAPDAVYVLDEVMVKPLWQYLDRQGLRVPEDVLVAAAGDGELFCGSTPVTTLEFNAYEAGVRAVDTLLDLIKDAPPGLHRQLIPTHLTPRASSGVS